MTNPFDYLPTFPEDKLRRWLLLLLIALAATAVLAAVVWGIASLSSVVLVLFLGWVVAILLEPLVALASRRLRLPRAAVVALIFLSFFVLVGLGVYFIVPLLIAQIEQLVRALPGLLAILGGYAQTVAGWLGFDPAEPSAGSVVPPNTLLSAAETIITSAFTTFFGVFGWGFGLVMNTVLTLTIAFYLLIDEGKMRRGFVELLPPEAHQLAELIFTSLRVKFGGFLRGTLIQAFLYGATMFLVMTIVGIPFSVPVSLFAMVAMLIPYLGPFLASFVLYAVALTTGDWTRILVLFVVDQVQSQFVLNVVGPRLFGHTVGLPPVVVLGSLLLGLSVAGVWGAIFAIPIAGVIATVVIELAPGHHDDPIVDAGAEADLALTAPRPVPDNA